jgi:hypothetical protein
MFDLDTFRQKAMQQGMKLMGDPRFQKLMMSPSAQKLMSLAFQLPGKIEDAFARRGKAFAKRFKLATREELETLKSTIRDLERKLAEQQQLAHDHERGHDEHAHHGKTRGH